MYLVFVKFGFVSYGEHISVLVFFSCRIGIDVGLVLAFGKLHYLFFLATRESRKVGNSFLGVIKICFQIVCWMEPSMYLPWCGRSTVFGCIF